KGQVEQLAANVVGALHIRLDESVLTCSGCLEPFDCLASSPGVAVQPGHLARRSDHFAHQPHDLARSAAKVETPPSRPQADRMKQSPGYGLERLALTMKPFIFSGRMSEHVVIPHQSHILLTHVALQNAKGRG